MVLKFFATVFPWLLIQRVLLYPEKLWKHKLSFAGSDGVDDTTVCDGVSIGKQPVDVNRLAKLTKKYKSGKIPPVDWLDRLTFAEIEKLSQKQKQSSNLLFLMIEFPQGTIHILRKQNFG